MGQETIFRHRRNDEIEVLRAIAVLFVVVGHINTLLYWRQDTFDAYVNLYGGVDLFFCISGFVITSAFGKEIASSVGHPALYWRTVVAFYIRRAYRILPLSWAVFFATFALLCFHKFSIELLHRSLGDFLAIAFNVQNFHLANCASASSNGCGQFAIYWSLSLEEQFYFLFPFLFLLPRRIMIFGLIVVVVLFAFLPRTSMVWMTRVDAIALGVLLACARDSHAYRAFEPTILSRRLFRILVGSILILGLAVIPTGIVPFYPTMVSLISLLLVFVASYDRGFLFAPGRLRSLLVWIGQRSFAIYLIHNTVFWIIVGASKVLFPQAAHSGLTAAVFLIVAVVLLAVISDLSFRHLETPIRKRGKQVADDYVRNLSEPAAIRQI